MCLFYTQLQTPIPKMAKTLITHIKTLAGILPPTTLFLKGNALNEVAQIDDAWLLIDGGRIANFGKMSELNEIQISDAEQLNVSGSMVFPAFVDSHTHLVFAGTRQSEFEMRLAGMTYEQIAQQGGGILNSAKTLAKTSVDELVAQALPRLKDVIAMGTGAVEIKSGYGLNPDGELKMLRAIAALNKQTDATIAATFLALHAIPEAYKGNSDKYVDLMINEVLPTVAEEKLAQFVDVFCEKGYFSVAQTERMLQAAAAYGLVPKIHVNQFNAFGGVAAGVANHALSVDHLEVMQDSDFEALKQSNTIATLLPLCSLFLQIPYAPAKELIANEIAIALATDFNPGSAPCGSMQLVQALACSQLKLTPNQAFNASTINGAAALGLAEQLGSITIGKKANIIISKPIPTLSYMAYNFGHNHVKQMVLNGKLQLL